jgi:hypothetical protein
VSEYPRDIPDLEGLHWADGGSPETITEPDESLKDDGYAANDKPAAAAWNWTQRELGRVADWLQGCTVRRFATLAEGIEATSPGDLFQVYDPKAVGSEMLSITPSADPRCYCCDGWRVFIGNAAAGVDTLRAYHASTGAVLWHSETVNDVPGSVCCDGEYVFCSSTSGGGPYTTKIEMFSALDGSLIDTETLTGDWATPIGGIACNGGYLVAIGWNATDNKSTMRIWPYTGAGFGALVGSLDYTTGASNEVKACAIGDTWAVMVGIDGTGAAYTVLKVVDLATAAELCSVDTAAWSTSSDHGLLSVATDGRRIYTAGLHMDPAAGTDYRNVFIWGQSPSYPGWDGGAQLISSSHMPGDLDHALSVDDSLMALMASSTGAAGAFTIDGGEPVVAVAGDSGVLPGAIAHSSLDGGLLWYFDGTDLVGVNLYREPRLYRRASGTDVNRGPLPGRLAQPVR